LDQFEVLFLKAFLWKEKTHVFRQICERKFFNFGIMFSFQIQLNSHERESFMCYPWATLVANLVENSPLSDSSQQMEPIIRLDGGVARMNCIRSSFKSGLSFTMSHFFVSKKKSDAKTKYQLKRCL